MNQYISFYLINIALTAPAIIGYDHFLRDLKSRIRTARTSVALSVNRELILLYWQIGRDVLVMQIESRFFHRQGKTVSNKEAP